MIEAIKNGKGRIDYSSKEYFDLMTKYWQAANYLSAAQIFLKDNPLLKRPLKREDVKFHPIGHWGTVAEQNFIYTHLNRVIKKYNLNMFYIEGSGHGGQVMISNSYLDGSYSKIYPNITQDEKGLKRMFKRFSFPGGVASHADAKTPGSIHEGGELGYALSHGVGAILNNPDVISAVEIGDGEAETGPLATSWFSNVFINPVSDGAALPILNLNGFKIANPTILARKSDEELRKYFEGAGWDPIFVEGDDPKKLNPEMAKAMDSAIEKIHSIQDKARKKPADQAKKAIWPMIILRAPKGWTGPKKNDEGLPVENSFRAHQVPLPVSSQNMNDADQLVKWLKSYHPEQLFDENGTLKPEIRSTVPDEEHQMAINPITNGGLNPRALDLPDWRNYALDNSHHGSKTAQDMVELGKFLRDVIKANPKTFRIFGPDETASNQLQAAFKVTKRKWMENIHLPNDEDISHKGQVIDSQLSEHQDEGFLEGYTLTGRHGVFASYEAFLRVVDSMLTQYFKWIREADEQPWRRKYPALNVISSSTSFQQDHNGYSHQDPGILNHLSDKKTKYIREYLPADANTLLAVMHKALNDQQVINLIVASKHPRPQFFSVSEAEQLVNKGLKVIDWASSYSTPDKEPDVVVAAAGTEPNLESLAAVQLIHKHFPKLGVRFINVVDLLKLKKNDPRALTDEEFDRYFTKNKPVIFAFHGYENLLRDIFFDRHNRNIHTHGYREDGDITTPFDMRVLNHLDRFHLAKSIAKNVYGSKASEFGSLMDNKLQQHYDYIRKTGADLPEIRNWSDKWEDLNNYLD